VNGYPDRRKYARCTLAPPGVLPSVIAAGVQPRLAVAARSEVEEPVGDVTQ
jgi:hypothetical protein